MPRGTWTALLILPLASSSGASRTSRMTTSSRFAISRTRAGSSFGTTALAAAIISLTPGIDFPPIDEHAVLVSSDRAAALSLARQRIAGLCRFPQGPENHGEEGGRPSRPRTFRLPPQDDGPPTNHAARAGLLPSFG